MNHSTEHQLRELFAAEGLVHLAQGDLIQRSRQTPAPAMPLLRRHQSLLAQTGHGSAHHHGIGRKADRQLVRGHRRAGACLMLGHVQQSVESDPDDRVRRRNWRTIGCMLDLTCVVSRL